MSDSSLAMYRANAVWIYRADKTLFYSRNNRYADNLREIPLPPGAFDSLFAKGARLPLFPPRGAGLDGNPRRHHSSLAGSLPRNHAAGILSSRAKSGSMRTSGACRPSPDMTSTSRPLVKSQARRARKKNGLITFSRTLPGWDGKPVARNRQVRNDSPIIRELNRASKRLFFCLLLFAAGLFLVLALSLMRWVRRPLRRIMRAAWKRASRMNSRRCASDQRIWQARAAHPAISADAEDARARRRNGCGIRKSWKRWAGWPEAWRTISTICSPRSSATANCSKAALGRRTAPLEHVQMIRKPASKPPRSRASSWPSAASNFSSPRSSISMPSSARCRSCSSA